MAWRAAPIGSRWSCVLAWCVLLRLLSCNCASWKAVQASCLLGKSTFDKSAGAHAQDDKPQSSGRRDLIKR